MRTIGKRKTFLKLNIKDMDETIGQYDMKWPEKTVFLSDNCGRKV